MLGREEESEQEVVNGFVDQSTSVIMCRNETADRGKERPL